ncbi:MAG: hypothetical protein ACJ8FU_08655 [Xanthobacteraceae bacterium]
MSGGLWGLDDYGRPMGLGSDLVQAPSEPPRPGYRLSDNVDNRAPLGSPYLPSQRAQFILSDLFNGPTSSDPARRDFARKVADGRMANEIGGFNQPRIEPGLSTSFGDRELRAGIFDALTGNDLYPTPVYTGRSRP